jgi:hypothetical protein
MLSPTLALSDEGEKLMLSFAPTSTVKVAGLAVDDVLGLDSESVVVEGLAVAITVTTLVAVVMNRLVASSVTGTTLSVGIMSVVAGMSGGRARVGRGIEVIVGEKSAFPADQKEGMKEGMTG